MTNIDLDQLFTIAEASPFLDSVENTLRNQGQSAEADILSKLQQDVGVQIEREMNGYDENEPAPGPESARLNAAYEPVTLQRFDVLQQAQGLLSNGDVKDKLTSLIQSLDILPATSSVIKQTGKAPEI